MATTAPAATPTPLREQDQRVVLHDVSWSQYETIMAIRGDGAGVRMTYLDGELELMSPSYDHEFIKKTLARLIEIYALETGLVLTGVGSWTVRKAPKARGVEPDECYVLGTHRPEAPDFAIEVIWTSGGIDKLEVYRGLGVREVWFWRAGNIEVHALHGERYERIARSELIPELDLEKLATFLSEPDQTKAVREYRAWLRESDSTSK